MSNKDFSLAPYYDDYDPAKGYTKLLAIPGRVEQAREFTQLQTILWDFLGRYGDAIFSNGTIISGCALVINDGIATITSGRIYLDGAIRLVDACSLEITGVGTEYIGAKVVSTIITENEDNTLRDPAQNYKNFGQPGSHRLQEKVVFIATSSTADLATTTANEGGATTVFTLENGEILKAESTSEEESYLFETLARRTYDENGSYKVEGLILQNRNQSKEEGIAISVSQGKAYVNGYEVTKPTSSTLIIDYATDTRRILNEPKNVEDADAREYKLNNIPAKAITRVTCTVKARDYLVRGSIRGGSDSLTHNSVVAIQRVTTNAMLAENRAYVQGTDYQLSNDSVDWSPSGDEIGIGNEYIVDYTYKKDMALTDDFVLLNAFNESTGKYESKLVLVNEDSLPELGSQILIDYDYYLARKDLITLDQRGVYTIHKGVPNVERLVESPINQDNRRLVIGTVLVKAGYSSMAADSNLQNISLSTNDSTRLSQENLFNMKKRIDDLEYNTALSDLDQEAAEGESATLLRGIFTDGFIGLTKADTGSRFFDCCIDLDNGELTLPVSTDITQVIPNEEVTTTNISKLGSVYMAPYVDELIASQPSATEPMLVNPYAVYNAMAIVQLNPSVDNWIDSSTVYVNETKTVTATLRRWWYHRGEAWAESEKQKWIAMTGTTGEQLALASYNGTTTAQTTSIILDEAIMYMREITVEVKGSNFLPNADNIQCTFDDVVVPLVPTGTTVAGTNAGTVKSDEHGRFTATFKTLKTTPCGTVNVVLSNANNEGTAIYTAMGRKQVIQDTVLTTRTAVTPYDPLAQAFQFDKDTILTQVGLYFAAKDDSKNCVVQVRNMVNGYPGTIIYDEVVVETDDIITSQSATQETIVKFNQPVYCHADTGYCICILSDSNNYQLWIATLGDRDVITKNLVTSQPYVAGVLFSSSNAMTWTAHQNQDLKFNLYAAKYTGEKGVIIFNDVVTDTMNRVVLAAQSLDYKNSGINWFYRLNAENDWLPLDTYVDQELSSETTGISLKVEIIPERTTSPILAGNSINLVSFIEKSEGCYVSRTVYMDSPFNTIGISLEAAKPTGTSFEIQYSTNNVDWITVEDIESARTQVDEEFIRYSYKAELSEPVTTYKVRINMASTNVLNRPRIRKLMNILRME